MKWPLRLFLWTSVIAGTFLPALSNGGYEIVNPEYGLVLLFCLLPALFCMALAWIPIVGNLLLLVWTVFTAALYFGSLLSRPEWLLACSIVAAVFFAILTFRSFEKALLLAGIVAFSQICAAAVATPSRIEHLTEHQVKRSDVPSVIHIMLDEHTGMATIPPTAVSPQEVQAFEDAYVQHGFIVFTHAYTADHNTPPSLARLLNPGILSPFLALKKVLVKRIDLSFLITKSSAFDRIGKERALDLTHTTFVNMTPAVAQNPALSRQMMYNIDNIGDFTNDLSLHWEDRLVIAAGVWLRYLSDGIKSPLAVWFFDTDMGETVKETLRLHIKLYPVISRSVFADMTRRLSESGQRGTYYFAHLIIPHDPYIFDKDCHLLAPTEWRHNLHKSTSMEEWIGKYKLHFGQASCAAQDVFHFLEAIKKRPELSDAVILVHSDHGSRIVYQLGHTKLDQFGSFIAIKIPGMEGRIIDTPVRLDTLYDNLLDNDFRTLDFDKLKPVGDSPYKNIQ